MPSLVRRAIAECIGTLLFVFFGCAAIVMNADQNARYNIFGIAMVHALALSLAITLTMAVSGGHMNPAVTIGLAAVRRIGVLDAAVYIIAQLVGAVAGAALVKADVMPNVGYLFGFGTPEVRDNITLAQACLLEALFAFLLMSAVMTTAVAKTAPRLAGFGIGLTLIPIVMVGGGLTGGVANPARAFGPALVSGHMSMQAVWWIGPIVGALAAALLWNYVLFSAEERAA